MSFKSIYPFLIIVLVLSSCATNPEDKIPYIDGYWEIKEVKKDGKLIKEYSISTSVDYFEINDNLTGFRKKVSPTFNGTFTITQDQAPFTLKIENDTLNIYYNHNNVITKETIIKASKEVLIIANSQGFHYIYEPFESINIE